MVVMQVQLMSPDVVKEGLRRLRHDLAVALGPTGLELHLEPAPPYPFAPASWTPPDYEICLRFDSEHAMRYGIVATGLLEPQVARIADNMQDDVIEQLMTAWPPCSGHSHPASAQLRSNQAVWVCPADGHVIARIGELPG